MTALERHRLRAKLTRAELATQAGVAYDTIRRHEDRHGDVSDATLFKLAAVLGVEPDLLRDNPAPTVAA
jgi:transcriptional regulator with XRE-family HTH domain